MTARRALPTDWDTNPLPEQRTAIALDRVFSPNEMDGSDASVLEQWASVGRATLGDHPDDREE